MCEVCGLLRCRPRCPNYDQDRDRYYITGYCESCGEPLYGDETICAVCTPLFDEEEDE